MKIIKIILCEIDLLGFTAFQASAAIDFPSKMLRWLLRKPSNSRSKDFHDGFIRKGILMSTQLTSCSLTAGECWTSISLFILLSRSAFVMPWKRTSSHWLIGTKNVTWAPSSQFLIPSPFVAIFGNGHSCTCSASSCIGWHSSSSTYPALLPDQCRRASTCAIT